MLHLIEKTLEDKIYFLKQEEKETLEKALLGYCLKVDTLYNVHSRIKTFSSWDNTKNLKKLCCDNYDLILGTKLSVYKMLDSNLTKYSEIKKCYLDNGLKEKDIITRKDLKSLGLYKKCLSKSKKIKLQIGNTKEVNEICNKLIEELNTYIIKFVKRKHRFIIESQSLQYGDIINELQCKAINTFYMTYPFEDKETTIGMVKRAVRNHGINLIYHYNTKKRARLTNNDGVFSSNTCTVNRLPAKGDSTAQKAEIIHYIEDTNSLVSINSFFMKDSILKMKQDCSTEGTILRLLLYDNNKLFIDYYNKTNRKFYSSVKEIHKYESKTEILENIRNYMNLSKEDFKIKLDKIKTLIL